MSVLSMFQEVKPMTMFARVGAFGRQGCGKTVSLSKLIIGHHIHSKSKKPVIMLDTEGGSQWIAPLFEKHKVPLLVKKTRSYNILTATIAEFDKVSDFLFIDSITHFWKQFMEIYRKKTPTGQIRINDWGIMKPLWNTEVVDQIKNANGHVYIAGRESIIFSDIEDDNDLKEDGTPRTRSVKTGERMNAEGELGYDLDLLLHMTKEHVANGGRFVHRATVVKDKNIITPLEGKTFDDPGFKEFKSYIDFIECAGAGSEVAKIDMAHDESLKTSREERDQKSKFFAHRDREAAVEEFETIFKEVCKGPNQQKKNLVLETLFGTTAFENGVKKSPAKHSIEDISRAVEAIKRLREASRDIEKGVNGMDDNDIKEVLTDGDTEK